MLENAQICRTLDEAIADSGFVVGATARPRSIAWPSSDPASVMTELLAQSQAGKVSLLFGREASGLTNEELDRCQRHVRIPANEDYPSLNLAAAVLIFGYELRRAYSAEVGRWIGEIDRSLPLASAEQVQGFFQHLETVLNEIGFLKSPSVRLMRKIKRIFSRTSVTGAGSQYSSGNPNICAVSQSAWERPGERQVMRRRMEVDCSPMLQSQTRMISVNPDQFSP